MHASLVRRQLSGLIPPKVATPSHFSGGSGQGLSPLVNFYSKLPKGSSPTNRRGGIRARYFTRGQESGAPLVYTILGVFLMGYTIDYQMHLKHHKNHAH